MSDQRRHLCACGHAAARAALDAAYAGGWRLSSSSDRTALDIVDGTGPHEGHGPHYSRRTPGARTFTGIGREIVLVHESSAAVWAVVHQRTPAARGTGQSRGRTGKTDAAPRCVWRNMLFRRLPSCPVLASNLVRSATEATYLAWSERYGCLPAERLRTEICITSVKSSNPGYCYLCAGWERDRIARGKLFLFAPCIDRSRTPTCAAPTRRAVSSGSGARSARGCADCDAWRSDDAWS